MRCEPSPPREPKRRRRAFRKHVFTADNNRVIDADVITDAGSTINTARLDIVAFVPHLGLTPDQLALLTAVNITVQDDSYFRLAETNAQTATEYVSQGIETVGNAIIDAACWLFGCDPEPAKKTVSKGVRQVLGAENETKYLGVNQVDNTINFNSTVNLGAGTPRPIVEIDATGRVTRLEGITLSDGVGPVTLESDPCGRSTGHRQRHCESRRWQRQHDG